MTQFSDWRGDVQLGCDDALRTRGAECDECLASCPCAGGFEPDDVEPIDDPDV